MVQTGPRSATTQRDRHARQGAAPHSPRVEELAAEGVRVLREYVREVERPLLAYSGGKDSIAVAMLAEDAGLDLPMVCETSFVFERAVQNYTEIAEAHGWRVDYVELRDIDWLHAHREIIFTEDSKVRAWTYAQRQIRSVNLYAKWYRHDGQIFGRRRDENTVPAMVYKTRAGLQCHPLREWSQGDVWAYLAARGIPTPWIYATRFGELMSTAPFYSLIASQVGGVEQAWALVEEMDPRFTRARLGLE